MIFILWCSISALELWFRTGLGGAEVLGIGGSKAVHGSIVGAATAAGVELPGRLGVNKSFQIPPKNLEIHPQCIRPSRIWLI